MNPLPSEPTRCCIDSLNGANIGSFPKRLNTPVTVLVVEIYTTAFLVFSTTSTITVRRRFNVGSAARKGAQRRHVRSRVVRAFMSKPPTKQTVGRYHGKGR